MTDPRRLQDLSGIGKAMLQDFQQLGVSSVAQLATCDPQDLYDRLCALTGSRQDPCVLDTFSCAVAQARNPALPPEQRNWWWWSRQRKARGGGRWRPSGPALGGTPRSQATQ